MVVPLRCQPKQRRVHPPPVAQLIVDLTHQIGAVAVGVELHPRLQVAHRAAVVAARATGRDGICPKLA